MSTSTEYLQMTKPAYTDVPDIAQINENFDILDDFASFMSTPVSKKLLVSGWSSSQTNIDGVSYYTYTINMTKVGAQFEIGLTSESELPTNAEIDGFAMIRYCTCTDSKTITIYADDKPTIPLNIEIFFAKG